MRTPKQTDPQFKLRLTPEIDDAIEAAAAQSGRKKNGEILARLEQSLLLPDISIPPDLLARMQAGSDESMQRAKKMIAEEIVRIFADYFPPPPPKRKASPDEMYRQLDRLYSDAPDEERLSVLGAMVDAIRSKLPDWNPPRDDDE